MTARARALTTTLVLVVVAAGAIATVWFGIARREQAKEERSGREARLFSFQPGEVTGLTVAAKGEVTRLVRAGDRWRIEAPVQADADPVVVTSLVDRLAELRRTAPVAQPPADLARYGLATPRATVTLTLASGKSDSLALGDDNAFDGTVYVATSAGAVSLVPGDVRGAVERGTTDLRDRTVLRVDRDAVAALRFRRGSAEFEVRRESAPGRLSAFLWTLSGLRAKSFVDETGRRAGELGLERPALLVTILGKEGAELGRLAVSAPRGGITYARSSSAARIVEVEPSALASLPRTAADAAEKPAPAAPPAPGEAPTPAPGQDPGQAPASAVGTK